MKRWVASFLCLTLAVGMTACGGEGPQDTVVTQATKATEAIQPSVVEVVDDQVRAELDAILKKAGYEGIAYVTHNGKAVYEYAAGNDCMGAPMTIASPTFLCSVSKQFCAAAILMLRDQGKLSLEDTLDKYFPEYALGKDITLHHLLCMRSGICRDVDPMLEHPEEYENNSHEENVALFLDHVFSQPLLFTPGTKCEYSNNGYRLLSLIVEQVSGQDYEDFIRGNIFEPLGMEHSGFSVEVAENPQWGLDFEDVLATGQIPILAQGGGGIVSTAGDMAIWMEALPSGKVISREIYEEMTADHNSDQPTKYGYGLMPDIRGGFSHDGGNQGHSSWMYFSEENGYTIYIATPNTSVFRQDLTIQTGVDLRRVLFQALDAQG